MEDRVRRREHVARGRPRGPAARRGGRAQADPRRDRSWKPHVVFNLLEQFHGEAVYDQNVASYLELLRVPYTGCNPRGLMLARGKDLSKKLLIYHRIPVPAFAVFPMRRKVRRPPRLGLPLIVKSLNEDASYGISQASVVDSDEKLAERVTFIHERIGTAAIAEQYIEGRELYVGVLGNERLRVLPIWELEFGSMPQGARPSPPRRSSTISSTSSATTSSWGRPRTSPHNWSPRSSAPPSASIGRWSSTAMPASISASPSALPYSNGNPTQPEPNPELGGGGASAPRPPGPGAHTCSSASWRWASAGPGREGLRPATEGISLCCGGARPAPAPRPAAAKAEARAARPRADRARRRPHWRSRRQPG